MTGAPKINGLSAERTGAPPAIAGFSLKSCRKSGSLPPKACRFMIHLRPATYTGMCGLTHYICVTYTKASAASICAYGLDHLRACLPKDPTACSLPLLTNRIEVHFDRMCGKEYADTDSHLAELACRL